MKRETGLHRHLAKLHGIDPAILGLAAISELAIIHGELERLGALRTVTIQRTGALQHMLNQKEARHGARVQAQASGAGARTRATAKSSVE